MTSLPFEHSLFRQFYQTRNVTGVCVRMRIEPTPAFMAMPTIYGATRIDAIHTSLFAKFPSWQHAAEFHHYAHDRERVDIQIIDVVPLLLQLPRTYESFTTTLKERYLQAGHNVATRTIIVEAE